MKKIALLALMVLSLTNNTNANSIALSNVSVLVPRQIMMLILESGATLILATGAILTIDPF
jgi:hypothetical protein